MYTWVGNYVGNDHFNTYSISNLSPKHARKFWYERIASCGFHNKPELSFEEVHIPSMWRQHVPIEKNSSGLCF